MDLPQGCFRCGQLGHHRPSCTADISLSEERLIKQLSKRMQYEYGDRNYNYHIPKKSYLEFPVIELEKAMDHSIEFYLKARDEILQIGEPGFKVEDCEQIRSAHHLLNMDIFKFRKDDMDLGFICKQRARGTFKNVEERIFFHNKIEDFIEFRHNTYNVSNKLTMKAVNALASARVFWDLNTQLNNWILKFQNMGRPNFRELQQFGQDVRKFESSVESLFEEYSKLKKLCIPSAIDDLSKITAQYKFQSEGLNKKYFDIENKLRKLELENEKEKLAVEFNTKSSAVISKITCNLCWDGEKSWSLLCGHMFCTTCINSLATRRVLRDRFGIETVLPYNECAYCKGSMNGRHRIFF